MTALNFNSEHILFLTGNQAGQEIIIPILQEAEVQKASVFFHWLAGWTSAGHREEDHKLQGKDGGHGSYHPPNQGGLIASSFQVFRNLYG